MELELKGLDTILAKLVSASIKVDVIYQVVAELGAVAKDKKTSEVLANMNKAFEKRFKAEIKRLGIEPPK